VTVTKDAGPAAAVGSPEMALDEPLDGSHAGSHVRVSGWAIDLGATDGGTGVSAVHVWAYPNPGTGAAPIFLGAAQYGAARPDLAALYGDDMRASAFSLDVHGLQAGTYLIAAFALSTVTGTFNQVRTATFAVEPDTHLMIDTPSAGTMVLPAKLAGWVVDASSDNGPGIHAVHAWASPLDGGSPIFVAAATYGLPRPDVAAAFHRPDFVNSGYSLMVGHLPAGRYRLYVYARRTGAAQFDAVRTIDIVADDSRYRSVMLDAPQAMQTVTGPFAVSGWAVDLTAPSGPGVDVVHVWAVPASGGPSIFLGAAAYGAPRPDVAAFFASSQATNSAFSLIAPALPPGTYQVVAYARSTVTGTFGSFASRTIIVSPPSTAKR
jgi:hypothetical protein